MSDLEDEIRALFKSASEAADAGQTVIALLGALGAASLAMGGEIVARLDILIAQNERFDAEENGERLQ